MVLPGLSSRDLALLCIFLLRLDAKVGGKNRSREKSIEEPNRESVEDFNQNCLRE